MTEPSQWLKIPESLSITLSEVIIGKNILGSGSFGQVVDGELLPNPSRNRNETLPVAIKIINKSSSSKPQKFGNLQNEINICAELRHQCIINTWGVVETEFSIYIVMDKADGELFKYIKKYGLEDMPIVAPNFIAEVVLGLEYMQQHNLIHRDLKPENLLLTSDYHVKIADFGTVCRIDDDVESNGFAGTPYYVSPEVILYSKASRTSDLWALGCIVYQLFVGNSPFQGETQYLVMQAIKNRRLSFPPGEKYFPPAARDLVDKLLNPDSSKRLGANGFNEIKSHPFFSNVKWDSILDTSNITHLNANYSKEWERFLLPDEQVVYCSKIIKKRHLSTKIRWLILTDFPRLFYIDPETEIMKGQVPWSDGLCAAVKDDSNFTVHTRERDYFFNNSDKHAALWVAKINDLVKKRKNE